MSGGSARGSRSKRIQRQESLSISLEVTQTRPARWNRSALISVIRTTPMRYSKWFLLQSMHRWFVLFYSCLLAKTRLVSICCYCYCCCYCCSYCCGWCWCECGIVLYGCLSFIVWLLHIYSSSMYSLYFHAVWSNRSSSCRSRRRRCRQPQIRSRNAASISATSAMPQLHEISNWVSVAYHTTNWP